MSFARRPTSERPLEAYREIAVTWNGVSGVPKAGKFASTTYSCELKASAVVGVIPPGTVNTP